MTTNVIRLRTLLVIIKDTSGKKPVKKIIAPSMFHTKKYILKKWLGPIHATQLNHGEIDSARCSLFKATQHSQSILNPRRVNTFLAMGKNKFNDMNISDLHDIIVEYYLTGVQKVGTAGAGQTTFGWTK